MSEENPNPPVETPPPATPPPQPPPTTAAVIAAEKSEREIELENDLQVARTERDNERNTRIAREKDLSHLQDENAALKNPTREPVKFPKVKNKYFND